MKLGIQPCTWSTRLYVLPCLSLCLWVFLPFSTFQPARSLEHRYWYKRRTESCIQAGTESLSQRNLDFAPRRRRSQSKQKIASRSKLAKSWERSPRTAKTNSLRS
ncbi:expressed unknown protein [Seminavis robusta]|uniref:Uncharacterized protein n=1 Tax=Seminavis robusta TaxID=568900 RepID=A0A9N8ETT4_9STRA|nr:expressed unknown protein [Seminavis robusta]|eukprot:Sro2131_g315891.1  (105) ;mRNA; f:11692-12006